MPRQIWVRGGSIEKPALTRSADRPPPPPHTDDEEDDRLIDQVVYQLYRPTEEEIGIVEGKD